MPRSHTPHNNADGFLTISAAEYNNLLQSAIRVEDTRAHKADDPHEVGKKVKRQVSTQIEVPIEERVKVRVTKNVPTFETHKKIVKGTELVAVQKFKEVQETSVVVKEEVVHGTRLVWKQVREPYTKVVKRPTTVTKTKRVPYTDYIAKEVEKVVEVPCHRLDKKDGYRIDKKTTSHKVDVVQDEIYEMRPHLVGRGNVQIRTVDAKDLGLTAMGDEHYPKDYQHRPATPGSVASFGSVVDGTMMRPRSASRLAHLEKLFEENAGQATKFAGAAGMDRSYREGSSSMRRPASAPNLRRGLRDRRGLPTRGGPTQLRPGDPPFGSGLKETRGPQSRPI